MQRSSEHSLATSIATFVLSGLVAGAVVAAAAFPGVAIAGLAAKAGADAFENLPSELQTPTPPQATTILTSDGKPVTSFYDQNRRDVDLSKVPSVMQKAVVATEDNRFYQHHGVDVKGILRAFVANSNASDTKQGASTLTQQYVRQNLVVTAKTPEEKEQATEVTTGRKLREIRYAIALEKKYNKAQIMQRYLNIVYFGKNAYGVSVAANRYFGKKVNQLTLSEAALLAGYIQSPGFYPTNQKAGETRRTFVLKRMLDLKSITKAQHDDAVANPPKLKLTKQPATCLPNKQITSANNWGFLCDYLKIWWAQQPQFGADKEQRLNLLKTGGLTVRLSLNPKMQKAAQEAVESNGSRTSDLTRGAVLVEPGTGRIRAMGVNRTFDIPDPKAGNANSKEFVQFPVLTGDPALPKNAGYHSGSTFKMFTMLAALKQGMPLHTSFNSPHTYRTDEPDGSDPSGYYSPTNAAKFMDGRRNMYSGFGQSVNTYFVQLEIKATVKNVAQAAHDAGISFFPGPDGRNSLEFFEKNNILSLTFGQGMDTFPLYMANAYATVAARGVHCEPTPVQDIRDASGKVQHKYFDPKCKRAFSQGVADAATDAARCPVGQGAKTGSCGGNATGSSANIGRPMAGKTGSTPGNKQLWFAGFTPQLAAATFSLNAEAPNNGGGDNANVANHIFSSAMSNALEGVEEKDFQEPPANLVSGGDTSDDEDSGDSTEPEETKKPQRDNEGENGDGRPGRDGDGGNNGGGNNGGDGGNNGGGNNGGGNQPPTEPLPGTGGDGGNNGGGNPGNNGQRDGAVLPNNNAIERWGSSPRRTRRGRTRRGSAAEGITS